MDPFDLPVETIEALAAEHGTPLFIVSRSRLVANYRLLDDHLPAATIYYAVKANPHPGVLETLKGAGAGFDVASKGEILAAVSAGANPRADLIFADTVKCPKHIAFAHGIGLDDFTYDNRSELTQLGRHAPGAKVHLRLAVSNEGSVAHLSEKFGARPEDAVDLLLAARDSGLDPHGVAFHVGSQCLNDALWVDALRLCRRVFDEAAAAGLHMDMVDIGGGFPCAYGPEAVDLRRTCEVISDAFEELFGDDVTLVAEPGRGIVGDTAILVTKVISKAHRGGRDWLYFDDGTYGSFMDVLLYQMQYPLRTNTRGPVRPYVLAGPTCDSIDVFSRDADGAVCTRDLPEMDLDDLLIAGRMGAYTFAESTRFNGFEPASFVYID